MTTVIEFSSLEYLEKIVRKVDRSVPLVFTFVGTVTLAEAAIIYRHLEIHVKSSRGSWTVDEKTMQVLRNAGEHSENLGLLDILLELVELDLNEKKTIKAVRFQDVRYAANAAVSSAHISSSLSVLDGITIEAQRLARVTKALGFGAAELELPELTGEDLDWLAANDDSNAAEAQLEGDDSGNRLVQTDPEDRDAAAAYHRWILSKEEIVVDLICSKITKIHRAIAAADSSALP